MKTIDLYSTIAHPYADLNRRDTNFKILTMCADTKPDGLRSESKVLVPSSLALSPPGLSMAIHKPQGTSDLRLSLYQDLTIVSFIGCAFTISSKFRAIGEPRDVQVIEASSAD